MSGKRGFKIMLAALVLLSIPILAGCADRRTEEGNQKPPGEENDPQIAPDLTEPETDLPEPEDPDGEGGEDVTVPRTDKTVRVAIKLDNPSVTQAGYSLGTIASDPEGQAYQEQLRTEQDEMIRRIEEQLGHVLDVRQRLTMTTNVISANVYPDELDSIRAMEGVVSVTEETLHEPTIGVPTVPGNTVSG